MTSPVSVTAPTVPSRAAVCIMGRNRRLDQVIASERIAGERIALEQQDVERR